MRPMWTQSMFTDGPRGYFVHLTLRCIISPDPENVIEFLGDFGHAYHQQTGPGKAWRRGVFAAL